MRSVTTFEQLKSYADGQVVDLPPFAEGQPFTARLGRPSMLILIKTGRIPNELLQTATTLFMEGKVGDTNDLDTGAMKNLIEVLEVFCKASFLEPTYAEIRDAGLELTDEQLMFVFNYAQTGVKALNNFRRQLKDTELGVNVENL